MPGVSEAVGEVAGVRKAGGPLRGGVDVEAAGAEELLKEGGVTSAWENIFDIIRAVEDWLEALEEAFHVFGVLAPDEGEDVASVEADGGAVSLLDEG